MVKVALFVRLDAKPGKEKEVESFLLSGLQSCRQSRRPRPGSDSAWGRLPSASLMPFQMKPAARLIFPVGSLGR